MKASIIRIGNSRGIRIPKPIFEACGFENEVELELKDNELRIRRSGQARADWSAAFEKMAETGDDALLELPEVSSTWDEKEWEWK